MTEKRQISDDELVEITGAGEFDAVQEQKPIPPTPEIPSVPSTVESDNEPGGDQDIGGA